MKKFEKEYFEENKLVSRQEKYGGREIKNKCITEAKRWIKILNKHSLAKGRLLDVGCAYGYLIEEYQKYYDCYGTDISNFAVKQAKQRLPDLKDKLIVLDCTKKWPYPDKFFDIIIFHAVLEHVQDYKNALKEAKRCLKNNGLVLVSIPSRSYISFSKILPFLPKDQDKTHISRSMPYLWSVSKFFKPYFKVIEIEFDRLKLGKLWKIERYLNKRGKSIIPFLKRMKIFYYIINVVLKSNEQ